MLRQTEPRLVAFYDIRPGNVSGLFLQPWSPHRAASFQDKQGRPVCQTIRDVTASRNGGDSRKSKTCRASPKPLPPT